MPGVYFVSTKNTSIQICNVVWKEHQTAGTTIEHELVPLHVIVRDFLIFLFFFWHVSYGRADKRRILRTG
jgi:hypothetical protein